MEPRSAPKAAPDAVWTVAGRYRLEHRLGRGAHAEVWRARDLRLDRLVALKRLHPHLLPDAPARERFAAEARAVANLAHPGIVAVHDVLPDEDAPVIVLEYVPGESLAARLAREGTVPPRVAARIAADIAEALAHAHARGLIHRDVKPANILIDREGRARLVDFGIARSLEEGAARITAAGGVLGTLQYMAPEQLTDAAPTPAIDVYALGAVLYEMLAGRPPFRAESPLSLLAEQQRPPPRPTRAPGELVSLALACLQPEPARRPSGAHAVADSLTKWLYLDTQPPQPTRAGRRKEVPGRPGVDALRSVLTLAAAVLALVVVGALFPPGNEGPRAPGSPSEAVAGSDAASGGAALSPASSPPVVTTPQATPTRPQQGIVILRPADGAFVSSAVIRVSGRATPGARIVRDVPLDLDAETTADENGGWSLPVKLAEGQNELVFRVADDRSTEQRLRVFYVPGG